MPILPLGIPTDLDKYFYNREKDLITLKSFLNTLNHDVANQMLVTGYRGVGKSFLLKKLLAELPDNILTAYIDMSKIFGIQKGRITEELIMNSLLEEMNESLREDMDDLTRSYDIVKDLIMKIWQKKFDFKEAGTAMGIAIPDIKDNYEKLSKFVMEFPQRVVELSNGKINGFVIVIDEFQLIGELESPEAFFWLFRSYTQEQDNVSYIFTGSTSASSDIVDKINGIKGAFGGRMTQYTVDPFTREESEGYLKERVSELKFTESGLNRFYKCTRGYPAYINSFCNTMSGDVEYDDELVIQTFYEKIEQIAIMWTAVWATLSGKEKDIITTLIENGPLNWSDLLSKVDFSNKTLAKYVNIIKNKGILSHSGKKYMIDDHMLFAWLEYKKERDGFYPP
ncbi:ATP-binding protein [Methanobacterium sp.]|uniref:AAA family ATPase n=1 Tax=Methanobacterium sp. TaxID=2164 RepID=UPI0031587921